MRFSRISGAVLVVALLSALPVLGQNAMPSNAAPSTPAAPAPAVPAPTLTPPGSTTGVPLLPGSPGGTMTMPSLPSVTFPSTGLSTTGMGTYPGLGGSLPGMGGTGDLTSLLAGTSQTPLTMTLGQLDSSWRRMTITGSLDLGSVTQVVSTLMGSAGIGVYYTKGQTVSVGNTTYLIAYRTQPRVLNIANLLTMAQSAMSAAKPPAPEVLTQNTPLSLSLLNLQTTGSLTDIRPFDLHRELADSRAAVHAYNQLLNSVGAMGGMTSPKPPHAKAKKTPLT